MTENVKDFPSDHLAQTLARVEAREKTGGGGPPDNRDMEPRIAKLESLAEKTGERLAAIEKDVAVVRSNYATKADIAEAKNSIIMWVVSAVLLAQVLPAILKKLGM